RSEIITRYLEGISDIPGIHPLLPYEPDEYVYQMFGIRTDVRDDLMIFLKSQGIATGCHYTPLSIQPLFRSWGDNCSFVEKEYNRFITLPLHADLADHEVDYIIHKLHSFEFNKRTK
ncbi:MAG: DegT/DnrJ/EryC1/StrS family aminotransferase, partial [Thermodesulfovibrionales bacterium]|nr:DegT/DnrJ/EryC1/StrS family aminotransferase [Thermodesulfovibrionales bacterium]